MRVLLTLKNSKMRRVHPESSSRWLIRKSDGSKKDKVKSNSELYRSTPDWNNSRPRTTPSMRKLKIKRKPKKQKNLLNSSRRLKCLMILKLNKETNDKLGKHSNRDSSNMMSKILKIGQMTGLKNL